MQFLGATFCGLVAVQLVVLIASSIRRAALQQQRSQLDIELLREQIRAAGALRSQREQSRLCWNGVRKFVVEQKVVEADNVCSFHLVPHDRKPLPLFQPGQFLTFKLRLDGADKHVVRCYSISSAPNAEYYRITIKRVPAPRGDLGAPPGLVSNYFHDHVEVGDILDAEAPRGKFCIDPTLARPLVLIAGGVGITPFASMIRTIIEAGSPREVILFYGVRTLRDAALGEELRELTGDADNVTVHVCYSHVSDEEELPAGHYSGHASVDLMKRVLGSNNYDYYLCGPPPMMDCLISQLQDWGVPKTQIFTEAFGAATGKAVSKVQMSRRESDQKETHDEPQETTDTIEVKFSRSAKSSNWDRTAASLLEFARKQNIEIESGCEIGHCGTCVVAVKSGSVICLNDQCAPTEEGTCLACISVPGGDLVLDA